MLNNDNGIDINKEEAVRYYKQTLHKIIIMYYFSYSNKSYNIE